MSRYSPEDRERILAAGRQAISDAETVYKPRPATADWPPCEDRVARFRREAREQAEALPRSGVQQLSPKRKPRGLSALDGQIGEQEKRFVLE